MTVKYKKNEGKCLALSFNTHYNVGNRQRKFGDYAERPVQIYRFKEIHHYG